jgi:hypothetical protein
MVNETYQTTNGRPNPSYRHLRLYHGIAFEVRASWRRRPSIVVGGVTPTHGGWESQLQGQGAQDLCLKNVKGMRNAER